MKLIVGLGNPGEKYKNSRHNTGYVFVDELKEVRLPKDVVLKKTDTFMNESGSFVKRMVDQYKVDPSDLYIAHDDLDIPLGSFKIQFGVGPKVHNGVNSVEETLGTKEFWRIRIGVDNRKSDDRTQGEEYVLQDFTSEEKLILERMIKEACKKLVTSFKNTN